MSLICKNCSENWDLIGRSYKRKNSNKIDYFCLNCKSKLKPTEQKKYKEKEYNLTSIGINSVEGKSNGILMNNFVQPESINAKQNLDSTITYWPIKENPLWYEETKSYDDIPWGILLNKNKTCRKHIFIPDNQVRADTPTDYLGWIGEYIAEKKPDVIVSAGDFADMESLCSYDYGKIYYEGRRYKADIDAAKNGMKVLTDPWGKIKDYTPEMHLTIGNHENRITRAIEDDPKMDGFMSLDDLKYESFGWKVHPFLEVVEIDGVHYSHYFCNQLSGKPIGGESILLRLKNIGFSFVMGHQQIYLTGVRSLNNGKRIRGIVQGSCYLHDESYRGPQSNNEWRGILVFHEVQDGDYSLMEISLDYLCRRYEGMPVWEFMLKKYPKIFKTSTWMQYQRKLITERDSYGRRD